MSLNWFKEGEGHLRHLCIRNLAERSLFDVLGESKTAVRLVLNNAKRLSGTDAVLRFECADDVDAVINELVTEISEIDGPGFIAQAVAGTITEKAFVFALTYERSLNPAFPERKIRVQLILEEDLLRLIREDGKGTKWHLEQDSPRYQRRSCTVEEMARCWKEKETNCPDGIHIAMGRVYLTGAMLQNAN